MGHPADVFESAADFLAADTRHFSCLILDQHMPNMTGVEFLRSLRREQNGARPIVVFCTTENDVGYISEAMSAGANEYVVKPYDREILKAKLAQIGFA